MAKTVTLQDAFSFTPSALISLYTLDGTAIGLSTIYRFVNSENTSFQAVTFNGVTYTPFPIQVEKMEVDGKGTLPKPVLTVSNIKGFVSNLLLQNGPLDGATVTRQRVHARFLDASNFPTPTPLWVTPDPTAAYPAEPFTVNRRIKEDNQFISWELASPLESQGAKLPRRQIIANKCQWRYRDSQSCQYAGPPVADIANRSFTGSFYNMTLNARGTYDATATYSRGDYVFLYSTIPQFATIPTEWVCTTNGTTNVTPTTSSANWVAGVCAKTSAACLLRFPNTPLRTSAMPGVSRAGWISRA